eukprot:395563-Amphidinium_carterae.2
METSCYGVLSDQRQSRQLVAPTVCATWATLEHFAKGEMSLVWVVLHAHIGQLTAQKTWPQS